MFSIPRRCCTGKHHQCWGWDMNQGQWAWVILEMAGTGCRKGETVSRTPCRNKSVLHIRGTSRGANDALEEHGSRAWESPRAVLHCSPVPFQEACEPRLSLTQAFFVLHFYSAFELEPVCREGCGLLIVFKQLFTLSVTGPSTSLYLHKYVSQCWHLDLKWENSMITIVLCDLLEKTKIYLRMNLIKLI